MEFNEFVKNYQAASEAARTAAFSPNTGNMAPEKTRLAASRVKESNRQWAEKEFRSLEGQRRTFLAEMGEEWFWHVYRWVASGESMEECPPIPAEKAPRFVVVQRGRDFAHVKTWDGGGVKNRARYARYEKPGITSAVFDRCTGEWSVKGWPIVLKNEGPEGLHLNHGSGYYQETPFSW